MIEEIVKKEKESEKSMKLIKGKPFPLGASETEKGMQFAIYAPFQKEAGLHFYEKGKEKEAFSLSLGKEYKTAHIFSVIIEEKNLEGMEYTVEIEGKEEADPYAIRLTGMDKWGKREKSGHIRAAITNTGHKKMEADAWREKWEKDKGPELPFSEAIFYQLHVRGFTKHRSSNVEEKGTFKGLERKLPYLKELGVTSLLLLPAYEFDEIIKEEGDDLYEITKKHLGQYKDKKAVLEAEEAKNKLLEKTKEEALRKPGINYWGYGERAWYFAPKKSYAYCQEEPEKEFKELVAAVHKEGMELLMDMHFAKNTNPNLMIDCLRFWVLEYHVDGFRINDNIVPACEVAKDPVIGSVKLLSTQWNEGAFSGKEEQGQKVLAEFNDGFMNDIRRFLKGDENQVGSFFYRTRRNPDSMAVINCIANNNGFTLQDLVSYDVKHNEANGEKGQDGSDYNFSWNCGAEGKTRRKAILELRKKQMKNGLLMVLLSQGTPLLLSGDEFGCTRLGNNNAYCQDNETSWINWDLEKRNEELLSFTRRVIALRKEHRILHMPKEFRAMDYASFGCPDISFHGTRAWYPDEAVYSRMAAALLCGKYASLFGEKEDNDFYIAYNMHWEEHEFDLPKLSGEKVWEVFLDTGRGGQEENPLEKTYLLKPRSAVVFISAKTPALPSKASKKKKNK